MFGFKFLDLNACGNPKGLSHGADVLCLGGGYCWLCLLLDGRRVCLFLLSVLCLCLRLFACV